MRALILVGAGAWLLGSYISRPINMLEEGLLAILNGQSDKRFELDHAELGGLAFRIDQLLNQLMGVEEDNTDDEGRPSNAPTAANFREAMSVDGSGASAGGNEAGLDAAALRRLAAEQGVATPHLTQAAQNALLAYRFPGNVRELENILERALTLCSGDEIDVADLHLREEDRDDAVSRAGGERGGGAPLGTQLEEIERDAIIAALEQTRYNKTAAAKLLGLTFRALRYRIKKLGIE